MTKNNCSAGLSRGLGGRDVFGREARHSLLASGALAREETLLFPAYRLQLTRAKRIAFLMAFCTLALLHLSVLPLSAQSPRAKQIGMHLKCMCRGCDMTAGNCAHPGGAFSGPCDTAKAELREVDEMLAKNMTEQQIIDAFVAKYGSIVYVEPPKKGFGLVAWIMPIFYVVVGLAVVVYVVRKWTHRPPPPPPVGPGAPNETLDRARAQVDRETED